MKSTVTAILSAFVVVIVILAVSAGPAQAQGPSIQQAQSEAYNGPKARIAVSEFEDKMSSVGLYRAEYGRGMADMLATSLFQTNRFIVLEREKLQAVLAEQNLGASGRIKKETAAAIGELEGAELLVTAAITGFDPGQAGGTGALGGVFGNTVPFLSQIGGGFTRARIAADLRLIDTKTGRIVAGTNAEGSAVALGGTTSVAGAPLGIGLGGFAKTPMESAIREMIQKAVNFVVAQTPVTYYRVGTAEAAPPPMGGSTPAPLPSTAASPSLKTIRTDVDKSVLAQLTNVTRRGAVLSVSISLSLSGPKPESAPITVAEPKSYLLDYETGQKYELVALDGFTAGAVKAGETPTLRATFKAPANAKTFGITLGGLGTFDDVTLGQ